MAKKICLMIECKDKNIFTSKKNLSLLNEFANHFDIKLHFAKTDSQNIVSLEKIPEIFCNQYDKTNYEFEIVKKNVINQRLSRQNILRNAQLVKEKMEEFVLSKNSIAFSTIQEKFNKYNLSDSALNNLFRKVREHLSKSGITVLKIKNGHYEIKK
jgi:hypothetical protein